MNDVTRETSLRERYRALSEVYWHHSIQLLPDLLAKGGKSVADLELERRLLLDPIDLRGRSVIEIGSWTGFHAFAAKRAGAARVIATDKFAWTSDHWRGRETFELARDCLELDVEAVEIDPTELPGPLEPADVVLFFGVFYHMHEPVTILKKICALARDVLVVETHQDLQQLGRPAMALYPGTSLNNDPSNWWGPNPERMAELLDSVGFGHVFYQQTQPDGPRGYFHAFRDAATAARYLHRAADNVSLFDLRSAAGRRAVFGTVSLADSVARAAQLADAARLREEAAAQSRGQALADLQSEVARLHSELARAQQRTAALEAQVTTLVPDLMRAQQTIAAMLGSTCWRVTAPLRFVRGLGRSRA